MINHQINFSFWILSGGSAIGFCLAFISRVRGLFGYLFIPAPVLATMIRLLRKDT